MQPNHDQIALQLDRVMTLDFAQRGIAALYQAVYERLSRPVALTAATQLLQIPEGATVVMTTGFASRGWVAPRIAENDGPAGAALIARALHVSRSVIPVVLAEEALLPPLSGIFQAAGMVPVSYAEAQRTRQPGGSLAVVVLQSYPQDDGGGRQEAGPVLDSLQPAALLSVERVGRNQHNIYHSARGVALGTSAARVDYVFDEARQRGIPTFAVGDGGNEIGMGLIADTVRTHIRYGDHCVCGCGGGIGATTAVDYLVPATVSNWGCYAIVAAMAFLEQRPDLLHTAALEGELLHRGVALGLINSPQGRVDPHVDAIPLPTHQAIVELLHELALRGMRE